jgi:hypothetical protein
MVGVPVKGGNGVGIGRVSVAVAVGEGLGEGSWVGVADGEGVLVAVKVCWLGSPSQSVKRSLWQPGSWLLMLAPVKVLGWRTDVRFS